MKRFTRLFLASVACLALCAACENLGSKYSYDSVEGDPMHTRIYTLKNGLRVYLTQNPDEPRIQTYIAVRTGSKNDPAESTGLAHYLEHLMFKGTSTFGTQDYQKERPLLDSIEAQYEIYGHTTDPDQRKQIYHRIDSFSYQASRYAIANEYDKLMAGIGSTGSNAFTSNDVTCYQENIPSNEVEQWAMVQADRFRDMVIRGFHTELEAVYEEYNMYLTRDFDKIDQAVNGILFPHHPYGTQTTIGTQEHLKNPSLVNVKNYYHDWYVPNNIAICLSGDLDPEQTMAIIDKYFGDWAPSDSLPQLHFQKEKPLAEPVYKEVIGPESEAVVLAWSFPGQSDPDADKMHVICQLLSNEKAGLFDQDLNQSQKVLQSQVMENGMADYSAIWAIANPKEGQSLDEARDLMLDEIQKLKSGKWDESLLKAVVNNMKRRQLQDMQSNEHRASMFVDAFINGIDWKDEVEQLDRLSKLTKQDIVAYANKMLTDGYACVYKRQGIDPNEKKIEKPQISPIETNRDKTSAFVDSVLSMPVHEIEPVFPDFQKDVSVNKLPNGNELITHQDKESQLFDLTIIVDRGSKTDKVLDVANQYVDYLGTDSLSAEQLQMELYKLACDANIRVDEDRTRITVSGLSENMAAAVRLCEAWLNKTKPDKAVYDAVVGDILKNREDAKSDQRTCFQALVDYAKYGPVSPTNDVLSAEQLSAQDPTEILAHIRDLQNVRQHILYYGPMSDNDLSAFIQQEHAMSDQPAEAAPDSRYVMQTITEPEVLIAPYNAKNIYMMGFSDNGEKYDAQYEPAIALYNEYFGGGMNGVVFQELRESRGLAYSAGARYSNAQYQNETNSFYTQIITQNDKMRDCLDVFDQIVEKMPQSENAFKLAKDAIVKRLATERTLRERILFMYLACRHLGLDHDYHIDIYNKVKDMTLKDLTEFQQKHVKGRTYHYAILGNERELDMDRLDKIGPIHRVSLEEIFGY